MDEAQALAWCREHYATIWFMEGHHGDKAGDEVWIQLPTFAAGFARGKTLADAVIEAQSFRDPGDAAVAMLRAALAEVEGTDTPCGYRYCAHPLDTHTGEETARGLACAVEGCGCTGFVVVGSLDEEVVLDEH